MESSAGKHTISIFALGLRGWLLFVVALALGYVVFRTGVDYSAQYIWGRPEYGHGLIIPFIAAFLIWQRRYELEQREFPGAWSGVLLLVFAAGLQFAGVLSSLFIVQQYAAVVGLYGLVLALTGGAVFRRIAVPLAILLFMIPLPSFLYNNLSAQLQLISSMIGVAVIRFCDISVYLEGNVIDLGSMKLQVAEACSGLRYLFPLMTLGFIMAYFFQAALWKRVLVFLSSIPVTIGMNSLRIGLIGITVEYWGLRAAEGFLHDFEGWVIFMASTAVLILEVVVLASLGRDRRPWREVFGIEFPPPAPTGARVLARPVPRSFMGAIVVLVALAVVAARMPERVAVIPARAGFMEYPMALREWKGERQPLEQEYQAALMLDDYLLADFRAPGSHTVNLYVAWYDTQQAGRSAHSPRSCLPGGGWEFESFTQRTLPGVSIGGHPVRVNRVVSRLGLQKYLVYYFFKQRDRVVTNEYAVKWFLFQDALTRNRTDGALVRLTLPLGDADSLEAADAELTAFAAQALPRLAASLPD